MNYRVKPNAFETAHTWMVTEEALIKEEKEAHITKIPYNYIKSIRLYFNPLKYRTYNYECEIMTTNNQKIKIQSTSYKSLATFDNQAETYNTFVKALITQVNDKNPSTQVFSGLNKSKFILSNLFTLLVVILVFLALSAFAGPLPAGLIMFGYYLFYIIKGFKKNWPKAIDGVKIPSKVLPSI